MTGNLYKQIGGKIKRVRENLGLSQEELARRLGYTSPATISHFEKGQRKISIADLQKISQTLGTSLEYFFDTDDRKPEIQRYRFRAINVKPSARKSVDEFLVFAQNHTGEAPQIPDGVQSLKPGEAAESILEMANIKEPPVSPERVAEELKVPVFYWDFPNEVSGIVVTEEDVTCIGVNQFHPNVRQRFTIAHELGHLIYHREDDIFVDFLEMETASPALNDEQLDQETKANQFSASLLMPMGWIKKDFRQFGDENLLPFAQRYQVSEQALWFRLISLHLVDHH